MTNAKIKPLKHDIYIESSDEEEPKSDDDEDSIHDNTIVNSDPRTSPTGSPTHHHHHNNHHNLSKSKNQQLKDKIMQIVMEEVLPDIGQYDLDSELNKKVSSNGFLVAILKLFGCYKLSLHEIILTGNEKWVSKYLIELKKMCEKTNTSMIPLLNVYDDIFMQTPLSVAVKADRWDIVDLLLSAGSNVEFADVLTGRTPIIYSTLNKNIAITKQLMSKNATINTSDMKAVTPLMIACLNNDLNHVKLFCSKLVDIDAQDDNGWTSLHYATLGNAPKCCTYLLGLGARRDIRDKNKRKAVHLARFKKYGEVISVLEDVKSRIALAEGVDD